MKKPIAFVGKKISFLQYCEKFGLQPNKDVIHIRWERDIEGREFSRIYVDELELISPKDYEILKTRVR